MKQPTLPILNVTRFLNNTRGLSLLVLVMVLTVAAAAAVSIIVLRVKLQSVQRESLTKIHLDTIRTALQHYYLVHHDLPEAETTTPPKTVPVGALNLDQQYRLDAHGQFFHYNRLPETGNTDILGIIIGIPPNDTQVAAVLVAAGPDGVIAGYNQDNESYDDPLDPDALSDDIVMGIPLRAEATKIAQWAVEVLQRAAIAYLFEGIDDEDNIIGLFEDKNNNGTGDSLIGEPSDGDTYYPVPDMNGPDRDPGTPDDGPYTPPPEVRFGQEIDEGNNDGGDSCVPAEGGNPDISSRCLQFGVLENDPDCGRASFYFNNEICLTLAEDIVITYGLNQKYATDPWGNPYQWRGNDNPLERTNWVFYSMGPNEIPLDGDDIIATERLPP